DSEQGVPAQLSVEYRYAKRMGMKIGDIITFDIHGISIEGKIVNLRKVKWNSFQPNFFIFFQAGVLDDAPQTYLASISGVAMEEKNTIQSDIIKKFPNISMIDVSRLTKKILSISDQMSWAIKLMAYLSIFTGLLVVFSIARHEVESRKKEINLLKVLGGDFKDVRKIIKIEFGILGFFASLFGTLMSIGISFIFSLQMFDSIWKPSWEINLLSVVLITALSVGVALIATGKVLRQKPLSLLQTT
ncbi:MAG: FtsX-like permease family protein, partial [Nitrospinae bacterium]|nr:FtsX-like permease family protein [Nitrospinota bacterium]